MISLPAAQALSIYMFTWILVLAFMIFTCLVLLVTSCQLWQHQGRFQSQANVHYELSQTWLLKHVTNHTLFDLETERFVTQHHSLLFKGIIIYISV